MSDNAAQVREEENLAFELFKKTAMNRQYVPPQMDFEFEAKVAGILDDDIDDDGAYDFDDASVFLNGVTFVMEPQLWIRKGLPSVSRRINNLVEKF